jgi:hypothetical protein
VKIKVTPTRPASEEKVDQILEILANAQSMADIKRAAAELRRK